MTRNIPDFKDFYENAFKSIVELSSFLSENKPSPSFMNSVATLTKLVEEGVKSVTSVPKTIDYKYKSVVNQITCAKELLAKQWVACMKYYKKQIHYGRKKIKKFLNSRIEYYAEDKLHGIVIKIIHKPSYFWEPKEEPDIVLKKYVEAVHSKHLVHG